MNIFPSQIDAFLHWERKMPTAIFLRQPLNGEMIEYTFEQAGQEARRIAQAIKGFELEDRSHIALLSKNCAHWHMADLAIMMSGHISIPIYPTLNAESIEQILTHSESKAIIIGKLDDYESQKKGIPEIERIGVNCYGTSEVTSWEGIVENTPPLAQIYQQKPDDLYTIIYTSGTTGTPKGVMHSVGNFMTAVYDLSTVSDIKDNNQIFSFLPIAHVAERLLENLTIITGSTVTFPESIDTFAAELEATQPNLFFAVPRLWTKFQEKILEKLPQKKLSILLKIPLLNSIIKKKLQYKLGLSRASAVLSGAAPIAASLVLWYQKIGINIQQAYGMTEDGSVSHCNTKWVQKVGTVGKALRNVKIKLSPEGEICIKNNCLFLGYYKNPEVTAAVMDDEGFFKTGDIGEYDHDGFLTITGRVKDQFKTDKGKYISPAPIELSMSSNTDIEQICIVGTGIPQPIALITLSELGKKKTKEELSTGLLSTLNEVNPRLEKHEKIQKIVIMKEEWSVANGLCTPTLKVKRNSIEKIHQDYYPTWFDHSEMVIFE
jgi:long-chain acyl-CoA synthetase